MKSFYFRHFSASCSVVPALALLCFTGVARAADYTTDSECYKIRNTMPASLSQGQMLYAALVMSSCQKCAAKSQIFHYQYTDKSTDTGTCDTKRATPAPAPTPTPAPAPAPTPTPGATTPFNSAWKSSEFVELVLTQTGTYVIGKYNAADNGLMFGTVVGTTFHGFWVENSSSVACKTKMDGRDYWGRVHLTVSGKTLTGLWSYCDAEPSGAASATR